MIALVLEDANGLQPSEDAVIIKTSDHGRHWSNAFGTTNDPNGAAPPMGSNGHPQATFPGSSFANPFFINYGQDDNTASTADGGDTYVYAASTNGVAYDGSKMLLGRVPRSQRVVFRNGKARLVRQSKEGFQVQRKRWVVKRTLAWLTRFRRLSRDYEGLATSSEAFIQLGAIRLMLSRLSPFRY